MLSARGLHKTYRLGRVDVPVLHGVDLDIQRGEWVAILGASGSGKSTLMHLLGGLDRVDRSAEDGKPRGVIEFEGRAVHALSSRALDAYRSEAVGFIFQFYHLLPELDVTENVALAGMVRRGARSAGRADLMARAQAILERVGLKHRLRHRSAELSGGERQRVAIARALVNRPPMLLADEPTGNLDQATGDRILDLIAEIRAETGLTVLMVTHDARVASRADRAVRMVDGRVVAV
ncbi:MAG: ABC transporter ATP-binding protein [Phycisphaerae bacterium]|nr:ABC transporter ATP-binding protein [Phycisphaerae bacterium]